MNFVGLTQPKDEAKFKQLVAKANASTTSPDDKVVYEMFRGWAVIAGKQATIDRFEQASNAASRSLSDESDFTQSMDRLGADSIVRGYVNGQAVMDAVRQYGGSDVEQYIQKAGTLDWVAFRAGAKSDGIGFDAIVHGRPGELFKELGSAEDFEPELPSHVPQNTLFYLAFHGTKGLFAKVQKSELFKTQELGRHKQLFDDLDTLLQGENALYLRPGNTQVSGVPFKLPEITFVASPGKSEDGALIVDRLLNRELKFRPTRTTIDGTSVRKVAQSGVGLYYGNVDGRLVFTDAPAGIRGFKHPGATLADSDKFGSMKVASGLPDRTPGFVYIDIHSTIPFAEKLAQMRIPESIRRNLKPLDSAVEYAATRSAEAKISFFLRIK